MKKQLIKLIASSFCVLLLATALPVNAQGLNRIQPGSVCTQPGLTGVAEHCDRIISPRTATASESGVTRWLNINDNWAQSQGWVRATSTTGRFFIRAEMRHSDTNVSLTADSNQWGNSGERVDSVSPWYHNHSYAQARVFFGS